MLLLLRSASGVLTATVAGIGTIVASGSTISASVAGVGAVNAPTSIEVNVSAAVAGAGGITAIPLGFLTRTGLVDGTGSIVALGGYSLALNIAGAGGVLATVGSFFDGGNLAVTGTGGLSVAGNFVSTALVAGLGGVTAVPIISGGTISAAASIAGVGDFFVSQPVQAATANVTGVGTITATGIQLSRSADLPQGPYISGVGSWDTTIRTYA